MPVVVVGSRGPFADAVALYSQHLARPPSASRPPPASAGRGRRRPRSASAAITPTAPQLLPPAEADAPRSGQERLYARPEGRAGPKTSRARPASAAATGGARACPGPPRPSRPRPVTATGARIASKTSSVHHDQGSAAYSTPGILSVKKTRRCRGGQQLHARRRVVSAGGYPSSSQQGDHRKRSVYTGMSTGVGSATGDLFAAKESAWEYDKGHRESTGANQLDVTRGTSASRGSTFYHEHRDLGTDPEVMQSATEFIAKILKATKNEQGKQVGTPRTSRSQSAHPVQAPRASMTGSCLPGSGTVKTNEFKLLEATKRSDARPARDGRRKRAEKVSMVSTTAAAYGGNVSTETGARRRPKTFAANTTENDADPRASSRRQQQKQQRIARHPMTAAHISPSTDEFPFPPGGAGEDLGHGTPARGENEEIESDGNHAQVRTRPNVCEGPTEKEEIHSLMTPLAFDVFCSLRPTFVKASRSKQERAAPTTAPGGAGLPNRARGGAAKIRDFPASAAFAIGGVKDRTAVACTWTSVFGAVCAGAERGRTLAEVLKSARREALRKKRRRKVASAGTAAAAAAAAAAAVPCDATIAYGKSDASPAAGATNDHAVNTIDEETGFLAVDATHSPDADAEIDIADGASTGETLFPEDRGNAIQPETSPLFRHPSGGGTTRIGVNAPRSLQVCPGDHGFTGVARKASRHCFSSPQRRRGREDAPSQLLSRRPLPKRPATASGTACTRVLSFDAETDGVHQTYQDVTGGTGRGVRPETAYSFFSEGVSRGRSGARMPIGSEKSTNGGSQSSRWTDGDSLRRRVDDIADAIARDLRSPVGALPHDGTRFEGCTSSHFQRDPKDKDRGRRNDEDEDEGIANEHNQDITMAGSISCQTGTDTPTAQRHQLTGPGPGEPTGVVSEACLLPTSGLDANRDSDGRTAVGLVGALGATDDTTTAGAEGRARTSVYATGDNNTEHPGEQNGNHPVGIGVVTTSGLSSADRACLTGDAVANQSVLIDPSPAAGDVRSGASIEIGEANTLDVAVSQPPASTATFASPNNSIVRKSRRPLRSRPTSAPGRASGKRPNSSFCGNGVRRCISSPGFVQGSHHPEQSLADIVDIAEAWKYPDGRGSPVVSGEVGVHAVEDAADDISCSAHGGIRGGEGQESSNSCEPTAKIGTERHNSGDLGRESLAGAALEDRAIARRRNSPPGGSSDPDAAAVARAGCVWKPQLSTWTAPVAVSAKVETPLEFRKAAVKLKGLVAEASVAVDGHEKAWRTSKEQAEQVFNDLRFAAEEDAQRSGDGAATETRRRLQRIVIESGLENSRRVEKEAALEEIRRVLKQDTSMYEARVSASDNMLRRMKTLEAENDSGDRSVLLECRRNKSLILLRDRTERERDELRAACRRRREEAAVMDDTLAEARHARGLLLGHTQHTVERMACIAEYVSVMRRWLGDKLTSRRHARVTSKAINLEFERKSRELDEILKKEAPGPTKPNDVDGSSSSAGPTRRKHHTKNVAPPANSDLPMSLETLRDASSRLRGLLLSLSTHVSSAQRGEGT